MTEPRVITVEGLQVQLVAYEQRYGVASDRLADAFRTDGELQETQDFLAWSTLYAAFCAASMTPRPD